MSVRIETFKPEMAAEISQVLAQAFVTNPLNIAAFGAGQLKRNENFFRNSLVTMKGTKLAAIEDSHILGFIHWVHSPGCQVLGFEKLKITPAMIKGVSFSAAIRISRWLSIWAKHDPKESHLHLGPIGISPAAQRKHIGKQLVERFIEELDRAGIAGYLEADRPENTQFYKHFGFEIKNEVKVLDVPNYFMWRQGRNN